MLFVEVVIVNWSKRLKNFLYLETKRQFQSIYFGEFPSTVKLRYHCVELGKGWICAEQISEQRMETPGVILSLSKAVGFW